MLSLEDAIKHAEEVAKDCETAIECGIENYLSDEENVSHISECAIEHRQLAEWLKELKQHREAWQKVKTEIADIYCGQYCENPYTPDKVRELSLEIIDNALEKIEQN